MKIECLQCKLFADVVFLPFEFWKVPDKKISIAYTC